ncbi:MAG: hypothetical protein EHM37_21660 [Deltaproteobacteria bacterium]|nr:MAG: hypothetical protein EHM37_21660 [Deltaproteobacteria bacterium]
MAQAVIQPYMPCKRSRRDEWVRLLETGATTGIAGMLGPLLPLEWMLRRGLAEAERRGQGFFVPASYVLSRFSDRLLMEIPAAAIKLRLADWISGGGSRLHIDTRFIGAGDWSGISSRVMDSPVAREAHEIFAHGLDYRLTPAYARYLERAEKGNPVRRNNMVLSCRELVASYFERFVDLFRSIQTHGVLGRKEHCRYADLSRPSSRRRLRAEWGEKEIGIAFGRDGQIYRLPGGQHRAAIAIVLGVDLLPVQVRLVHSEWALKRLEEHGGKLSNAILRGIRRRAKDTF